MIKLDAATVLMQWAVGGLFFLWVTTRRREVGIGYGWTIRILCGVLAATSVTLGVLTNPVLVRELFGVAVFAGTLISFVSSVLRRRAGVFHQRKEQFRRSARVAEMRGVTDSSEQFDVNSPEFEPWLDLLAPLLGVVALIAAGIDAGSPVLLAVARTLVGAAFMGVITDAMLLGHWYLVQPGLARSPILQLIRWTIFLWPVELILLLWPTGMVSVLTGTIDDGYGGILGWFWAASTFATVLLLVASRAALRERQYSAVMAATGLLYLAILTAFGMDLVARAVLA